VYQLITNVDSIKLQNACLPCLVLGVLMNDITVNNEAIDMIAPSTRGNLYCKTDFKWVNISQKPFS
jgi:hypothetical protein